MPCNYQKLFTYFIIAFIAAVTIHLMFRFKTSNNKYKNKMIITIPKAPPIMDNPGVVVKTDFSVISDFMAKKINDEPSYIKSSFDNTYQKEFGIDNNMPEDNSNVNNNIVQYQNDFFNFNSKINNTSHNEDTVDHTNNQLLMGYGEIASDSNMNISDLFDSLTNNNVQQTNSDNWPNDNDTGIKGRFYTDNLWQYNDCKN